MMTRSEGKIIQSWLDKFCPNTARGYQIDILDFFIHARVPVREVETTHIRAYVGLIMVTKTAATQRRIVTAIRSLFHYANEEGYRDDDPAATLRNSRPEPPRQPLSLSEDKMLYLLQTTHTDREYVILALAYYAALRGAEMVALLWGDVLNNRLRVREPPAPRVITLPQHLVDRLAALRGDSGLHEPLLSSYSGQPMTVRSLDRIVKALAERAGIDVGGLHVLRNTHAQHALARGASVVDVQVALGHRTPRSTIRHAQISRRGRANTAAFLAKPPRASRPVVNPPE